MSPGDRMAMFAICVASYAVITAAMGGDADRVIGWTLSYIGGWIAGAVVNLRGSSPRYTDRK